MDFDTCYYSDFVKQQIKELEVGGKKRVDVGAGDVAKFRMTLRYVCHSSGAKFRTKVDRITGDLWVLRVK